MFFNYHKSDYVQHYIHTRDFLFATTHIIDECSIIAQLVFSAGYCIDIIKAIRNPFEGYRNRFANIVLAYIFILIGYFIYLALIVNVIIPYLGNNFQYAIRIYY